MILFLFVLNIRSEGQIWRHYFSLGKVYDITGGDKSIFLGCEGRIVKIDRHSLVCEYWTPIRDTICETWGNERTGIPYYYSLDWKDSLNTLITIANVNRNCEYLKSFPLIQVNQSQYSRIYEYPCNGNEEIEYDCLLDKQLNRWMIWNYYDMWSHYSRLIKVTNSDTTVYSNCFSTVISGNHTIYKFEQLNSIEFSPLTGNVWASSDKGFVEIANNIMVLHPRAGIPAIPGSWYSDLVIDHQDRKWATTKTWNDTVGCGIIRYDNAGYAVFNTANSGLPDNCVHDIAIDSKDILWLATRTGLVKFDGLSWQVFNTSNSAIPGNNITKIYSDSEDYIWIVIDDVNVYRYDGSEFIRINAGYPAMRDNKTYALHVDKDIIYAGGSSPDILRINEKDVSVQNHLNFVQYNSVESILVDGDNKYYGISGPEKSSSGMMVEYPDSTVFFNGVNTPELSSPGFLQSTVEKIVKDKSGDIWLALVDGIANFKNGKFIKYTPGNSGLPTKYIDDLSVDSKDRLWVATYNGLSIFDGRSFTNYSASNSGLPSNGLWVITLDENDVAWIGTLDNELCRFDGVEWTTWDKANSSIPTCAIHSIATGPGPVVWLGTSIGLISFFNGEFKVYNFDNSGIPITNIIYDIAVDELGNVWLTNKAGISVFNEKGVQDPSDITDPLHFEIQPNPATDQVSVNAGCFSDFTVQIFNYSGQLVAEHQESNSARIRFSVDQLPAGFYLIKLIDQLNSRSGSGKLIVLKSAAD